MAESDDGEPTYSDEQLEAGRLLFAGPVDFVMGAARLQQLPDADRPEIAFAGRSNVGKSSLINALTGRKTLARTSNTPGRTQQLNYFDLGEGKLYLVDLPGYGFAQAPKKAVDQWSRLTMNYLRGRPTLKRVFLLIDSRRGVGDVDKAIMKQLDEAAVIYQLILTKMDKLKARERGPALTKAQTAIAKRPAAHPVVMGTSSEKGEGIAELRAEISVLSS